MIKMKKIYLLLTLAVMAIALTGCKNTTLEDQNVVYVTVYPMQFLVEEIAGETIEVILVPGATTHGSSIDWSAKEIIDMLDADLLFYINGGADTYITNSSSLFVDEAVLLVDMSQHIEYNEICLSHNHDDDVDADHETQTCDENSLTQDPHFWLDPVRMLQAAEFVKDKLIATFPENQELYNNNYTVLEATLTQLNQDFQLMADQATKPIMTTVRLFTYWAVRYNLEIVSITNDIHSEESNPSTIIEFVNYASAHDISYILFEKNANSPAGNATLADLQTINSEAIELDLHGLGKITLEEFKNGSTYITIMYDNLEILNLTTK